MGVLVMHEKERLRTTLCTNFRKLQVNVMVAMTKCLRKMNILFHVLNKEGPGFFSISCSSFSRWFSAFHYRIFHYSTVSFSWYRTLENLQQNLDLTDLFLAQNSYTLFYEKMISINFKFFRIFFLCDLFESSFL